MNEAPAAPFSWSRSHVSRGCTMLPWLAAAALMAAGAFALGQMMKSEARDGLRLKEAA
jgi:hypothetical protein